MKKAGGPRGPPPLVNSNQEALQARSTIPASLRPLQAWPPASRCLPGAARCRY